jgi:hypothetical protein
MATPDKDKLNETVQGQFVKNLDHILIDPKAKGPQIPIGKTTLKFKNKPPVTALGTLVGEANQIDGMTGYIRKCLIKGQEDAFNEILENIDLPGLGEIMEALSEGYTSFPEKS